MSKLQTRLTYIKRCGYCNHEEVYIMRETNVNIDISDEDAIRVAQTYIGKGEGDYCEACKQYTEHKTVAYSLPESTK